MVNTHGNWFLCHPVQLLTQLADLMWTQDQDIINVPVNCEASAATPSLLLNFHVSNPFHLSRLRWLEQREVLANPCPSC